MTEKIEAELTKLNQRREALQSCFDAASTAVVAAQSARREHLLGADLSDEKALRKTDEAARAAEDQRASLTDALGELTRRIEDAERRLEDERARAAREQAAAEREKAADAAEAAAMNVERAIEALATGIERLVETIPFGAFTERNSLLGTEDVIGPYEVARAALAEALYHHIPELFETSTSAFSASAAINLPVGYLRPDGARDYTVPLNDPMVTFRPASGAIDHAIVQPLRRAAARIRAGELDPALPAPPAPEREVIEPKIETTSFVFAAPVRWIDHHGFATVREPGGFEVPILAAEAARAKGLGFPTETGEGRALLDQVNRRRTSTWGAQRLPEPVDLGVDLEGWLVAERERLNTSAETDEAA
jgi:hypothetical protein